MDLNVRKILIDLKEIFIKPNIGEGEIINKGECKDLNMTYC